MSVCSKSRRGSSGIYEKDEKLTEKEKELMEKDAEVSCLFLITSVSAALTDYIKQIFCYENLYSPRMVVQ